MGISLVKIVIIRLGWKYFGYSDLGVGTSWFGHWFLLGYLVGSYFRYWAVSRPFRLHLTA